MLDAATCTLVSYLAVIKTEKNIYCHFWKYLFDLGSCLNMNT